MLRNVVRIFDGKPLRALEMAASGGCLCQALAVCKKTCKLRDSGTRMAEDSTLLHSRRKARVEAAPTVPTVPCLP